VLRKVLSVARHEFIGTVTRLGYIITLLGMPIFVGALGAISGFAAYKSQLAEQAERKVVGLVDESGLFAAAPLEVPQAESDDDAQPVAPGRIPAGKSMAMPFKRLPVELRRFPNLAEAKVALTRGDLASVLRIPPSYLLDGKLEELVRPSKSFTPQHEAHKLRAWLTRGLLTGHAPSALVDRAARPLWDVDTLVVEADGHTEPEDMLRALRPLIVPMGFAMLLMLSVFTSASFLATGLSEEKQNRALEMLLTSITPEQLFWGKLVGIGGAALLQFVIYLILVALPAGMMFAALGLKLSLAVIGLAYFVLGFFFFGSVLLAVGAIGNTQKYTQQLSGMFTFTAVIPMMVLQPILQQPQGGLARTLSYIPFTAPITCMLRAGAGALPWWEMILSMAALALGCAAAMRLCAKIFRVALLATGTTPTLAQVWSWMKA
jgi:ABC-2 type transport system permease protein